MEKIESMSTDELRNLVAVSRAELPAVEKVVPHPPDVEQHSVHLRLAIMRRPCLPHEVTIVGHHLPVWRIVAEILASGGEFRIRVGSKDAADRLCKPWPIRFRIRIFLRPVGASPTPASRPEESGGLQGVLEASEAEEEIKELLLIDT
ncbi:MAG: hypothetical protein HYY21_04235 [Candidatus Tectomicrobia bacterium]|nr:hypothetical protein [Candidatus Tectomicrobia bacterium]